MTQHHHLSPEGRFAPPAEFGPLIPHPSELILEFGLSLRVGGFQAIAHLQRPCPQPTYGGKQAGLFVADIDRGRAGRSIRVIRQL